MWLRGTFKRSFASCTASLSNHEAHSSCFCCSEGISIHTGRVSQWHFHTPRQRSGTLSILSVHVDTRDTRIPTTLRTGWREQTYQHFNHVFRLVLPSQWKQVWHGVPVSFVSVGTLPPRRLSEISFLEEALRISIHNVNCHCAGQARSVAVRHDHHRTFQHCQQGLQVFLENQDQASRHCALLAQVCAHLVRVLKIGMAVEAIRIHQSHDPCLDLGILAQRAGPGALRHMRHLLSRLLENASTLVNITVTLTNLRHHSGHARTPLHRDSPVVTSVQFQMSTGQDERQRLRPCEVSSELIHSLGSLDYPCEEHDLRLHHRSCEIQAFSVACLAPTVTENTLEFCSSCSWLLSLCLTATEHSCPRALYREPSSLPMDRTYGPMTFHKTTGPRFLPSALSCSLNCRARCDL